MSLRIRKLLGVILLLAVLVLYAAGASALYTLFFTGAPAWVLLIYFAIAGIGWGFPAAWVIKWMSQPAAPQDPHQP